MKTFKILSLLAIISLFAGNANAQKASKWQEKTIKVSSQCEMCKERIEKHLAFEKGVKSSVVNLKKSEVTVKFNAKKTSVEKLRKSLSKLGYDADDVKANKKAYDKLPGCCKKPEDKKNDEHKNCNHKH